MMQVDHVEAAEARPLEHALPRRHLSLRLLRAESGEHRIGRPLPGLVGAVERHRPGELILTALEARERGRVVRRLDVQPLEERAGMRLLPRRPERPRGEHDLPPGLHERAREIAGNLRRTAARIEHEAHPQLPASYAQRSLLFGRVDPDCRCTASQVPTTGEVSTSRR